MRRDIASGHLDLVAPGDLVGDDGVIRVRGARNPSISADGRYVVFSTGAQLVCSTPTAISTSTSATCRPAATS